MCGGVSLLASLRARGGRMDELGDVRGKNENVSGRATCENGGSWGFFFGFSFFFFPFLTIGNGQCSKRDAVLEGVTHADVLASSLPVDRSTGRLGNSTAAKGKKREGFFLSGEGRREKRGRGVCTIYGPSGDDF